MSFFDRVFLVLEADDEYREHPMDLPEKMFFDRVKSGKPIKDAEPLHKFQAKKPEFIDLQKRGFVKHHAVLRSRHSDASEAQKGKKKPKKGQQQEHPGYEGRKIVVHYWEHPETGERTKPKIVSPSPWVSRTSS